MSYLRIVSPTECPVEAFVTLGISTSKGKSELIGQFGSGSKHAVNVCLRHGINPIVFCGTKRLLFHTEPEEVNGSVFSRVFVKIGKRNAQKLSIVAEYGELDWNSVAMALREFVSNAIDAAGGTTEGVSIKVCEKVNPQAGKTVIGIPLTPEVQKWYQALPVYFLHFSKDKGKQKSKIIKKIKPDPCYVYRKSVLVRTAKDTDHPSLFDYNFGDELYIDEARNLSESAMRDQVATTVASNEEALTEIFRHLGGQQSYWEFELPEWELTHGARDNQEAWQSAWRLAHGDKTVVSMGYSPLCDSAKERGFSVVCVNHGSWYNALKRAGIQGVFDVLDDVNAKGDKLIEPTEKDWEVFNTVWGWLESIDLTGGKAKPQFTLFEKIQTDGTFLRGYYLNNTVHVYLEDRANHQTYLEEMAHYVTGAVDLTRTFQEFAFKGWCKTAMQNN